MHDRRTRRAAPLYAPRMTTSSVALPSPTLHAASGPRARLQRLVSPPRLTGIDAARGLAILGMIVAHTAALPPLTLGDPLSWLQVVNGNSSILFAVLAGVSIALLTGRERPPDPADLPRLRLALLGRGAAIFVIGLVLELLGIGIVVILTFYGLLYVAALPFLRLRPSRLIAVAVPLALLGPVTVAILGVLALEPMSAGSGLLVTGTYRFTTWMPLMLLGMAAGRLPLTRAKVAAAIATIGAALALLGVLISAFVTGLVGFVAAETGVWSASSSSAAEEELDPVPFGEIDGTALVCYPPSDEFREVYCVPEDEVSTTDSEDPSAVMGGGWSGYGERLLQTDPLRMVATAALDPSPHSGSTLEIITSGGLALLVIGLMMLLGRPLRWVLLPLSAPGSMPLTAYTGHALVILAIIGPGGVIMDSLVSLALVVGVVLACTAWAAFAGRGPLERLAAASSRWFTGEARGAPDQQLAPREEAPRA